MRSLTISAISLALAAALAVPADAAPARRAHRTHHPVATAAVCSYNNEPAEQARLVDAAMDSIAHLRADRGFDYAADVLSHAKAILIVPHMVKAGFIIGGEGGDGVVLVRQGIHWSNPAFYSMGAATFGLQAGVEGAELVLFIMSDRALADIMRDEFKVDATAGLAILTVGANAHDTNQGYGDIVVWSKAAGVFAGFTINGSEIRRRHQWDNEWYGRHVTVDEILTNKVCNYRAQRLRLSLHW
jgi:lipid-binding SYLF domain-containing protein